MIHIVTSTTVDDKELAKWARKIARKTGANLVQFKQAPFNFQAAHGDSLIDAVGKTQLDRSPVLVRSVVCPTSSEMLILRVLRRVREKVVSHDNVGVHCLTRDKFSGKVVERMLRIDEDGEFMDLWPDGFFEGRMEELY